MSAYWCPTCSRKLPPGASLEEASKELGDVVREVLVNHIWTPRKKGPAECWSADVGPCGARFTIGGEYRAHVASLIVERVFPPGSQGP